MPIRLSCSPEAMPAPGLGRTRRRHTRGALSVQQGYPLTGGGNRELERDVPVLALRSLDPLGLEGAQRADQLRARLVRLDHVVDVAALGRRVRVGEVSLVVVDQLGAALVRSGGLGQV